VSRKVVSHVVEVVARVCDRLLVADSENSKSGRARSRPISGPRCVYPPGRRQAVSGRPPETRLASVWSTGTDARLL